MELVPSIEEKKSLSPSIGGSIKSVTSNTSGKWEWKKLTEIIGTKSHFYSWMYNRINTWIKRYKILTRALYYQAITRQNANDK